MFAPRQGEARPGVAIGDAVLDLRALADSGRLPQEIAIALAQPDLKALLALGTPARRDLRHRLFALLAAGASDRDEIQPMLHLAANCAMQLPARPNGYTDFYAGIVHATNVGRLLRPDNPLMPNYKHIPIGYHGRTSSIRPSGTPVRRPLGQLKPAEQETPGFGPSARLDYEVELGLWIGEGNALGEPLGIPRAGDAMAGVTLLNDWSARDIQAWEYQPLGPLLAKNSPRPCRPGWSPPRRWPRFVGRRRPVRPAIRRRSPISTTPGIGDRAQSKSKSRWP
jgi:fumarylacetoacetase